MPKLAEIETHLHLQCSASTSASFCPFILVLCFFSAGVSAVSLNATKRATSTSSTRLITCSQKSQSCTGQSTFATHGVRSAQPNLAHRACKHPGDAHPRDGSNALVHISDGKQRSFSTTQAYQIASPTFSKPTLP